jgi:hypothetical protein
MPTDIQKIREFLSYRASVEVRDEAKQALYQLERWGGKIVEFLDSFEDSYENSELAKEALALQEEGLNLGLKKVYPWTKEG